MELDHSPPTCQPYPLYSTYNVPLLLNPNQAAPYAPFCKPERHKLICPDLDPHWCVALL
jgi:hypothetical protein